MIIATQEEVEELEHLFVEALTTDGAHHKQWFLERIAEKLGIPIHDFLYEKGIEP